MIGFKKNKSYLKYVLFFFSGAIMIAHGARMIYQGVFRPGSYYFPNTFDLFFDWATLLILGAAVFYISISKIYQKMQKDYSKEKNPNYNPT